MQGRGASPCDCTHSRPACTVQYGCCTPLPPRRLLPYAPLQVEALGGRLLRLPGRLAGLEELPAALRAAEGADGGGGGRSGGGGGGGGVWPDVVINTAGLGSRQLLGDEQVRGARGWGRDWK